MGPVVRGWPNREAVAPFSMSDKRRQAPRGVSQFDDRCHDFPVRRAVPDGMPPV